MTGKPQQPPARSWAIPPGGLPGQDELSTGRAVFTNAYAVIPGEVMRDIVTSSLPFWEDTRAWILARPLSGFAETFSQYIMEVAPGGGSERPDSDPSAQSALFVVDGVISISLGGQEHEMRQGGFAYIPAGEAFTVKNNSAQPCRFHWIRKAYEPVSGIAAPDAFFANTHDIEPDPMPGANGCWTTTRFFDVTDMRHDMYVSVVNFEPGGAIPFCETHVMEHGLYILEGKGVYRLNQDWVEVKAGDFLWLRAFCPQACYAGGPGPFRYLLYKDVNRHARLGPFNGGR